MMMVYCGDCNGYCGDGDGGSYCTECDGDGSSEREVMDMILEDFFLYMCPSLETTIRFISRNICDCSGIVLPDSANIQQLSLFLFISRKLYIGFPLISRSIPDFSIYFFL